MTNIYYVDNKEFSNLIKKWDNLEDIENFLFITKKNKKYLALDNEGADCYVEEFNSYYKAILWLVNKDLLPDYVSKLSNNEVRKKLKKFTYQVVNKIENIEFKKIEY